MKRNTIDLDFNDKHRVLDIICKVEGCRHKHLFGWAMSASMNGFHMEIWCKKDCELCRMVFDDQTRFMLDQERRVAEQNVLFDKKTYKKMGCHIVLEKASHV